MNFLYPSKLNGTRGKVVGKNSDTEKNQDEEDERIQFSVVGLLVTPEYQKCRYIVENLHKCFSEKFEEPELKPLLNLEWNQFLKDERRLKGGALWNLKKCVAVYCNGIFMGDDTTLSKYLSTRYILPMKDFYEIGQDALQQYFEDIKHEGRKCIYLMISVGGSIIGSMLFLLYNDIVPKTCELFLKRCEQENGGYSGTPIHRIVPGSWIQCGGYRLKEVELPNENYIISHNSRGIISMCNTGTHKKNSTQFFITLDKSTWMDTHYVAFGKLLHGDSVLSQIESVPTKYQDPEKSVRIVKSGEFDIHKPQCGLEKTGTDLDKFLDLRLRRRRKHKNYYTRSEQNLERIENKNVFAFKKEYLVTDLKSHVPLEMLPSEIQAAFNYFPEKKSSCLFEVENCYKCGCSRDAGKCIHTVPSENSFNNDDL